MSDLDPDTPAPDIASLPTIPNEGPAGALLSSPSPGEGASQPTLVTSSDALLQNNNSGTHINGEAKKPDDSQPIAAERVASQKTTQDKEKEKKAWNSTATLYCSKTGYPHSNQLNCGMITCRSCGQILTRLSSQLTLGDVGEEKSKDAPGQIPEHLKIGHAIIYQDIGGFYITTEERDRPFQLKAERNNVLRKGLAQNKEMVFKVSTVLRTTIPVDPTRSSLGSKQLLDNTITGNARLSVTVQYTKIAILSSLFIDALKSVISYDTKEQLESGRLELNEPFSIIGHHLEELEAYMRRSEGRGGQNTAVNGSGDESAAATTSEADAVHRETSIHVGLVLDFINPILKDLITAELARHKRDVPMCTYRMMWYLFRPGDTVYVMSEEAEDAYIVDSVDMDQFLLSDPAGIRRICCIKLWHLEFNGQYVTRARAETTIRPFKGERPITSLNVVPCEIWDKSDGGQLRAKLEERGKSWAEHLLGKQVEYKGEPLKPGKIPVEGRVYADSASYYGLDGNTLDFEPLKTGPISKPLGINPNGPLGKPLGIKPANWMPHPPTQQIKPIDTHTPRASYDKLSVKKIGEIVDEVLDRRIGYLLCSRKLKGFVFGTRTWQTLDVRYCHPVQPDKNPFARLVIPEERKMMIKALVYKYTDPRYAGGNPQQVWGADFIKHKGEGQIFLLHGGPGVGKTFTAECIAEFTGRPLLALTCGDIGTEEIGMETKLRSWLRLAHKWGAVMLIDEADVFLEKRMDADIKRNSLVSVFLREIEYYQGILFLTSNRVGRFDDAIISRIHVVIHYKDLDDSYRRKIWNQFFDKLQNDRGSMMKIENSARRYVLDDKRMMDMKWNGREIRNAFQTAVALAEYRFLTKPETEKGEGEVAVLEDSDFKQICDMTMEFKEYLTEMNDGLDEQARAAADKVRLVN